MIQVREFGFQYRGSKSPAVSGLNLEIPDGDFLGITGTSGAGKTTLLLALNGIIPQKIRGDFYGQILVDGKDTMEHPAEEFSRFMGEVFQDIDSQMVASVVEDEILFGMENFGLPHGEIRNRLDRVLREIGIEELREREISSLSGGQKQKVAIASILALEPDYIILDEPTGELDPESSLEIFRLLQRLNREKGITVVIVEQKIMLLCEFVKHLVVLDRGKTGFTGTPADIGKNIRLLRELGINAPRVAELTERLIEERILSGEAALTVDRAERMIREAIQ